jgi:uncharacterized protein involved in exopolysaccharide biosynthesis
MNTQGLAGEIMNAPIGPARPMMASGEDGDDFDFGELGRFIWRDRRFVAIVTGVCLAIALLYLAVAPRKYTAIVVVAPVQESGSSSLSGALSQFAGAASALGVTLPQMGGGGEFGKFQELLTSTRVAGTMINGRDPRPKMFRSEYDAESGRYVGGSFGGALDKIYRLAFGLPNSHEPDAWDVSRYLGKQISLETESKTGLLKISFTHRDPAFAAGLLNQLVTTADGLLKADRGAIAIRKIAYFNEKLKSVTMAENRAALITLLMDEEKVMSVIQINAPYAARVLIPPRASSDPTQPNVPIVLALGLFGGFVLALAIQVWRFLAAPQT